MIFSRKGINIRIALKLLRELEEHLPERVQEGRPLLRIIHTVLFCHISHPENEGILCTGKSSLHLVRPQRHDELIGILIRRQVNDPGFDPRVLQDRDRPHSSHSSGSVRVIEKKDLLRIAMQKRCLFGRERRPQRRHRRIKSCLMHRYDVHISLTEDHILPP